MNTITVIGQLGRAPELKTSQNGRTYLQNCIYEYMGKDTDGNPQYMWRDFVAYGATAESIARNGFHRGRLAISGTERTKTYTTRDGEERWKIEVTVSKVDFIDFEKPKEEAPKEEYAPQGFAAIDEEIPF